MKIILHHEEAQNVVCAKCNDVVAYSLIRSEAAFKARDIDTSPAKTFAKRIRQLQKAEADSTAPA